MCIVSFNFSINIFSVPLLGDAKISGQTISGHCYIEIIEKWKKAHKQLGGGVEEELSSIHLSLTRLPRTMIVRSHAKISSKNLTWKHANELRVQTFMNEVRKKHFFNFTTDRLMFFNCRVPLGRKTEKIFLFIIIAGG